MLRYVILARAFNGPPLDGTPLAQGLRNFIGPLFVVILALVAIGRIAKWNWMGILQIFLWGAAIAILLYRPDVIIGLGQEIANLLPGSGGAPG